MAQVAAIYHAPEALRPGILPVDYRVDGRKKEDKKAGAGPYTAMLHRLLRIAFEQASQQGVGRKDIAGYLGVSERSVDAWMSPSETNFPATEHILALVCGEGGLPPAARRTLCRRLAEEAGYTLAFELENEDRQPAPLQALEVAGAVGDLAMRVRAACAPMSASGKQISAAEASAIQVSIETAQRELAELRALVAKCAKGATAREVAGGVRRA